MEHAILLFVQENLRFGWLTPIMQFFSFLGDNGWFFIALGLLLAILPKTRKYGLYVLAALLLDAILINVGMKNIFHRIRPYDVYSDLVLLVKKETDFSFPSGHTGAAFAAAFAILWTVPKEKKGWGAAITFVAFMVAISRIYVAVHYPSDVLGGFLVAVVCGLAIAKSPLRGKLDQLAEKISGKKKQMKSDKQVK